MARLTIVDEAAFATGAADRMTSIVDAAIGARGNAVVSLTGGSTPEPVYSLLGDETQPWRSRIDWARVHLFWGDERCVPPDHPDSNFGMANARLVAHVPIPPSQVHRMRGEYPDPQDAAAEYEAELARGFAAARRADRTFDLMLLGIGDDGHIASIFPGSPLLGGLETGRAHTGDRHAGSRRVAAVWAPHLQAWRITLTPVALLDARTILLLAAGRGKADAIAAAIDGLENIIRWPSQLLRRGDDRVEWMIDRAAATRLADGRLRTR